MSINANAFCTYAQVIDHGDFTEADSVDNDKIERIINSVTSAFLLDLGTDNVEPITIVDYRMDGNGTNKIFPLLKPIISISSLYDDVNWDFGDDKLIDSSDYAIVRNNHIVYRTGIFIESNQNIKLTFTIGFSKTSKEWIALQDQCIVECVLAFKRRGKEDITSTTDQFGNVTYTTDDFTKKTKRVLGEIKIKINSGIA